MSKNGVILLIIAALVFLVGGFFLGQAATALINTPGSENDPLVAQSYVEKLVGDRTAAIQTQIEELRAELNEIKSGSGSGGTATGDTPPATGGTGSGDTGGSTGSTGGTSGGTSSDAQTVEITANSVNLRAAASTSSERVASAAKGDTFPYLGSEGEWYKIQLSDGKIAYVAEFLAKLN